MNLIIAMVILFSGFAFSACGESGRGYQLSNLADDYRRYVSSLENVNLGEAKDQTITFDYDSYEYNGNKYLSAKINDSTAGNPYAYTRTYYNVLLDNSMSFIYSHLNILSENSSIEAPASLRNEAKTHLDQFYTALKRTSGNVEAVADHIRQNKEESTRLAGLKNLFDSYTELYLAAFNLSSSMEDIYYNYAYNNANPDYSTTDVDSYNSANTIVLLNSRATQHKTHLTQSYFNMHINGSTASKDFTTNGANVNAIINNFNSYNNSMSKLYQINVDHDDPVHVRLNNNATAKQEFLDLAIAMHNYLSVLANNTAMYNQASNEVVYLEAKNNVDATEYERYCLDIIDNHAYILQNLTEIYTDMITILGSV